MPRVPRAPLLAVLFVLLLASTVSAAALEGRVVRVVDGDTIHVKIGERVEKVRYIGVNTPELHHPRKGEEPGGRDALAQNRALVQGRTVRLETDAERVGTQADADTERLSDEETESAEERRRSAYRLT